jgi:hypothetical protein
MVDLAAARAMAQAWLHDRSAAVGCELILLDAQTLARPFGWVFFYDSAAHQRSHEIGDAIAGNAPLVVRRDGTLHLTGTALPIEHYLAAFEREDRDVLE